VNHVIDAGKDITVLIILQSEVEPVLTGTIQSVVWGSADPHPPVYVTAFLEGYTAKLFADKLALCLDVRV
jgi:hypothetical protein